MRTHLTKGYPAEQMENFKALWNKYFETSSVSYAFDFKVVGNIFDLACEYFSVNLMACEYFSVNLQLT